ncbi:hypothetical protein [Mahella australiensis]|uniref:Uncharacterized protein n=1 Tax=Mahella australiensis (strain DSM 15567 / CIP 107919 / 50-1 BON) TaxID=697281 RepID=F3ZZ99_MAHA5|nr:hypothetical protein [Mahella australiensis]AEE97881.1 hypothetical protein Mahau_2746 [Mahella australiensis 50-1 BON]
MVKAYVDFQKKLQQWDGFGVNYVETAQTPDYTVDPQDYGGFSLLTDEDRKNILNLIFSEEGLKPCIIKMFLDPFHQPTIPPQEYSKSLDDVDLSLYEHTETTRWMRYFAKEGLKITRQRNADLDIITTLYGPPAWMTKQKILRGRDLDPSHRINCAKYMVSWARYLRDIENLPVKYISLHNEGEDYHRWPYDGSGSNLGTGHDYNMYWPAEQVVDFIKLVRDILNKQGMNDMGVAPGETTNWYRFSDWGYAYAIADDRDAVDKLGIITSHGFFNPNYGNFYGDHRSLGNDIIREKKPSLHSWVTSTSWSKMDAKFVNEIRDNIYCAKTNAIIPWACIQRPVKWLGGDPNPGTAFKVYEDGTYSVEPGYYFYKQVCRAGQQGMAVAAVSATDSTIGLIGFSANNTDNPNALVVINISEEQKAIDIGINGNHNNIFFAYRTSCEEKYQYIGSINVEDNILKYCAPPQSVTTFYEGEDCK